MGSYTTSTMYSRSNFSTTIFKKNSAYSISIVIRRRKTTCRKNWSKFYFRKTLISVIYSYLNLYIIFVGFNVQRKYVI